MSKKIPIFTEVAAAFDVLSIIEVKIFNCLDPVKKQELRDQKEDLMAEINNGIGFDLAKKIYSSKEYADLYNSNFEIFAGVDAAKDRRISGFDLDALNCLRFEAKKNLQKKFFNDDLKEIKLYTN